MHPTVSVTYITRYPMRPIRMPNDEPTGLSYTIQARLAKHLHRVLDQHVEVYPYN